MKNLFTMRNGKGFIGFGLMTVAIIVIILISVVLFNSFYLFFKIGFAAENAAKDYEYLSSGIYYGIWLVGKHSLPYTDTLTIDDGTTNKPVVTVTVSVNSDVYTIVAVINGEQITCIYDGVITSWAYQ